MPEQYHCCCRLCSEYIVKLRVALKQLGIEDALVSEKERRRARNMLWSNVGTCLHFPLLAGGSSSELIGSFRTILEKDR